jgi:hypothetical protein
MVQGQASFTCLLALVVLLLVSGCSSSLRQGEMTVADIEASRLGFLKDGITTKDEVKMLLGPPTLSIAKENVWGYRMTLYLKKREPFTNMGRDAGIPDLRVQGSLDSALVTDFMSAPPYELVLVFDESSRLKIFRVFSVRNRQFR